MNNKKYYHFENPKTLIVGEQARLPNNIEKWSSIVLNTEIDRETKWDMMWEIDTLIPERDVILKEIDGDVLTFVDSGNIEHKVRKDVFFHYQYVMYEYTT